MPRQNQEKKEQCFKKTEERVMIPVGRGGRRNAQRVTLPGSAVKRVVYMGSRGGKYVVVKGQWVSLRKAMGGMKRTMKGGYCDDGEWYDTINAKCIKL